MAKTYILVLAFVLLSCLASAGPLHHLHPTNIYSWGNNQYGQLGNGEQSKHQFAQRVKIPALPSSEDVDFSFTKIMASNTHVLASTIDKKLYGWGSNCNGALGLTNYTSWRAFPLQLNFATVLDFAVSNCSSWVVTDSNQLWRLYDYQSKLVKMSGVTNVRCGDRFCLAWDANLPNTSSWFSTIPNEPPPNVISTDEEIDDLLVDASIGQHHALLRYTSAIFAIGFDAMTQLGTTQLPAKILNSPLNAYGTMASCGNYSAIMDGGNLRVFGHPNITDQSITGVQEISCAGPVLFLRQGNSIITLGVEAPALLGRDPEYQGPQPTNMPHFAKFTSLARSSSTAEAMFAFGTELNLNSPGTRHMYAWGANNRGQLGIGTKSYAELPIEVFLMNNAASSLLQWAGSSHMPIYGSRARSSFISAYGDNDVGIYSTSPIPAREVEDDFFDFVSGETLGNLALATTGTEWITFRNFKIAGWNEEGNSALLVPGQVSFDPLTVNASQVRLECGYSTCFLSLKNDLHSWYLWGDNSTGQLPPLSGVSDHNYVSFDDPDKTLDLSSFIIDSPDVIVSLARDYSVMHIDQHLHFFGGHWFSGTGFQSCSSSSQCYKEQQYRDLTAIASGYRHTLVLTSGGAIHVFGDLSHQPSLTDSGILAPTGHIWTGIAAVQDASFAIAKDAFGDSHSVWVWGPNTNQLLTGFGSPYSYTIPRQLPLPLPAGLVMGSTFLCAKCRGDSMFLVTSTVSSTQRSSSSNIGGLNPPINEPGRVSFGQNQFGSLGVSSVRSPQLPVFMAVSDGLNPFQVSMEPNISVAHSRHGSLVSTLSSQYLYWRSYSQEDSSMPLFTTGYALSSSTHYGETHFGSPAVSGGSKIFGVATDTLYEYDFHLTQWNVSQSISGLTNVFVSPAQENADFFNRIPVTDSIRLFLNHTGSIVAYLRPDGNLIVNRTSPHVSLSNVTSASIGFHILAAIRTDFSVWTHPLSGSSELAGHTEPVWGRVVFRHAGRIVQVQCASQVTYALDHIGNVFAWGRTEHYGFGTYSQQNYEMTPIALDWATNPLVVNDSLQIVKISTDTWNDVHFWFGERTVQMGGCTGLRPPTPEFACVNGAWILFQPYTNSTLTISGHVVIDTELSLGGDLIFDDINSWLNSSSCVNINGSVIVNLSDEDIQGIQSKGSPTLVQLISAMCGDVQGNIQLLYDQPCLDVQVQTIESSENGYTLNGLFSVNEKDTTGCKKQKGKTWWIILVSVLGGVVLLVIIAALLVTFTPLKGVIRPFTKRAKE